MPPRSSPGCRLADPVAARRSHVAVAGADGDGARPVRDGERCVEGGAQLELAVRAPQLSATIRRYLVQLTTFLAPRSVDVADSTLRQFARWVLDNTTATTVAEIRRGDIEDFKVWLAAQPGTKAPLMAKNTQRQRLRMIRIFFERLIEWDWPDAPTRNPILHGDIPPRPEPLPKFLDDRDAAKLMATARAHRLPRYRIVVEILARTGLRAGELCDLAPDAVTQIGGGHWLRVPVGKLRNDRSSRCTPTSSPSSPSGRRRTSTTSAPRSGCWPTSTHSSTAAPSTASWPPSLAKPGSATPTPTSCATPSPPKPSTAGCASRRSPRSSATARWR